MNEPMQTPLRFGPGDTLVGMLTVPGSLAPLPVACLMLNMGANHRVGPRRINVKLAHALARRGMGSLRLDLGGIGDSDNDTRTRALPLTVRAVRDLRCAMDVVQARLGIDRFVIVGMCSGVEHAMTTALADARVVGLSLFDGYAFPQWRARWEHRLRRALAAPVHPAFAGKARRWLGRLATRWLPAGRSARPLPGFFSEELPQQELLDWVGASLAQLHERQVALHFLYSGSLHLSDRGRDLLGPLRHEPFAREARYDFLRELDHTCCTARGQQLFLDAVGAWAIGCAGAGATAQAAGPAAVPQPARQGGLTPQRA